ncbi:MULTISPECIES: chorismate mutase [unclassified Actinomyces]|uniref:chorismate mutase n=1 Tax=unclassified Actinomyces TaxID=2609248 RepID=UPI001373D407|nr:MULTISPECIES: chorismate mutase [unclassified Actinomyces]MBW3069332.1 chorismate mutase [Actinomyces sp. 594]NDR52892.1 chorismate mutase [Actinomyces sp. 565]QHO91329.1 chorismate mutase [Actinomyces sp. 432]
MSNQSADSQARPAGADAGVPVEPGSASSAAAVPPQLAAYRATIDNLDAALIHLLAERFRCTRQVGRLKADLSLPPSDPAREEQQVVRLRALAEEAGLDPVFAEKFFAFIVAEVIRHHEAIREELSEDD